VNAARRSDARLDRATLGFCLLILGITTVYPVGRLLFSALAQWQWAAIRGAGFASVTNTIIVSLASVVAAGAIGMGLAFLMATRTIPGGRILAAFFYLPFALPPLVGVLAFYYLIGRDGVLPRATGITVEGPAAILLIHAYSFFVFFYSLVSSALESRDAAQLEAARTLGASPWYAFRRVTVPLLLPALLAASLLTFMSSVASFSAPYFFGQDFPMLSVQVYNARAQMHMADALTLTVALAAVSLAGFLVFRSRRLTLSGASKGAARRIQPRKAGISLSVFAWFIGLFLLIPHMAILWFSLTDHRAWFSELMPTHFTLNNFAGIFRDPRALEPIRNSLWMSLAAAALAMAAALPAAYVIGRRRPGGRLLSFLVMIPWAMPGTVVAVALIASFNDRWLPVYGTVWLLPLAYFLRGLPLLARAATAAVEPFDGALIEAGRSLGASRAYCFRHIICPLIAPALISGAALVFVTSLGEFVSSILLYLPANIPIAVKINMEWRGNVGTAFAYSVFLMALVSATFIVCRVSGFGYRVSGKMSG
jgi:iron(III) transport system permease protein